MQSVAVLRTLQGNFLRSRGILGCEPLHRGASALLESGARLPTIQGGKQRVVGPVGSGITTEPAAWSSVLTGTCSCKYRYLLSDFVTDDEAFSMTSLSPRDGTGLPMTIWLTTSKYCQEKYAHLKVQSNYDWRAQMGSWFRVKLEEPMEVIGDPHPLTEDDIAVVRKFMRLNKELLWEFWEVEFCVSKLLDKLVGI
ncbi:hypothetical protein KFL_000310460 [Klebsormidium nitens]|uniref:Uncharacterized protein n=1 Tax=Klebsormidium nitens TaxID=105231 RepID=A0A1Y1HSF5_KLENI|nr:hypothetical protein KFL_000310460 [Klebsormidium nitens]|eukprot:GAQ79496.1 hypothetical protein KFL_000310460 [Klebsormidium nitens]